MSSHTYTRHHPDMKASPAKNYCDAIATVRRTEKFSSETQWCFSRRALDIEETCFCLLQSFRMFGGCEAMRNSTLMLCTALPSPCAPLKLESNRQSNPVSQNPDSSPIATERKRTPALHPCLKQPQRFTVHFSIRFAPFLSVKLSLAILCLDAPSPNENVLLAVQISN